MMDRSLPLVLCLLVAGCGSDSSGSGAYPAKATTSAGTTLSAAAPSTLSAAAPSTLSATAPSTLSATAPSSFTAAATATTPSPANYQFVATETVDVGSHSPRGVAQGAHDLHLATDADWAFFWPSHSQALRPGVDFTQETVVATFMGQMTVGPHFTRVINVARASATDDLRAVVREFRMGAWRPLTTTKPVLPSPFHIVRCATAVSGQGTLRVRRQSLLDFELILSGSSSALGAGDPTYTGGLHVLRDAAAFSALFAQVQPGVRPPGVDFQTSMIVAVLGPYIPSFGNSVETLRLVEDARDWNSRSNVIRVVSRVNGYRGGAAPPPGPMSETPFQFLRVSRALGTIRAEQTRVVRQTLLAEGTTWLYRGPAETQVIRDAGTFMTLWASRIGTPAPQVDFSVNQVLIAFEPAGNRTIFRGAETVMLEDEELSVTVKTLTVFGVPNSGAPYLMLTTPRNMGPVSFETVNITPRP